MWAANSRAVSAAQACKSSHHTMRTSYPKHGTIAFRSFPIECQSCLGPILTLWAFTTLFFGTETLPLPLGVGSMQLKGFLFFYFYRDSHLKIRLNSHRRF